MHAQLVRLIEASDARSAFLASRVLAPAGSLILPLAPVLEARAWRAAVLCMHAAWYP